MLAAGMSVSLPGRPADTLAEEIILTPQTGGAPEDRAIARWQERARAADAKPEVFVRLGWAFVAKARRTLDAGYYKLAEKTADAMDARFGASPESQLLRGHVLHNLHHFHEAEAVARTLARERGTPEDFGLLSDALMEQGRLDEAVAALQRMVNLRPGVEAYTRIAHLRWLKGDLHGAIAAMELAWRTCSPRDAERYAWVASRLSAYWLEAGDTARALGGAEAALRQAGDYPPGLLAEGRVLLALGRKTEALPVLERAARLNPLPEYRWWLADALRAAGRPAEARQVEAALIASGEVDDPRTLALFLATRREQAATAVRLARAELKNRADVFTHDALAWALAANGDFAAADAEMKRALAEQTQDARLFWHAGEIALDDGRRGAAAEFFAKAQPLAGTLTPGERARLAGRIRAVAVKTPEGAAGAPRPHERAGRSEEMTAAFFPDQGNPKHTHP